jgi:opacity protein-like surface antigen
MLRCNALCLLFCFVFLSNTASSAAASDFPVYIRGLMGLGGSFDTTFEDTDCSSSSPAAYFGCGTGQDGRPLGAYGDFGRTALLEAGLGIEVTDYLRVEAVLDYRPGFAFDGNANFLRAGADQPVSGEVTQMGVMAFAYFEPLTALGYVTPIKPFIGAGAGASWNEIGEMTYKFPALRQPRYSQMPGGTNTSFAWSVVGGAAYDISDRLTLDISYRYSDLGEVRTDEGTLFIQRSSSTLEIPIAETKANLTEQSIAASFRWRFLP